MAIMTLSEFKKKAGGGEIKRVSATAKETPQVPQKKVIPGTGGVSAEGPSIASRLITGAGNFFKGLINPDSVEEQEQARKQLEESRSTIQKKLFDAQAQGKDTTKLQESIDSIDKGLDSADKVSAAAGFGRDIRERVSGAVEYGKESVKRVAEKAKTGDVVGAALDATQIPIKTGGVAVGQGLGVLSDAIGRGMEGGFNMLPKEDQKAIEAATVNFFKENPIALDAIKGGQEVYNTVKQSFTQGDPQKEKEWDSAIQVVQVIPPAKLASLGLKTTVKVGEAATKAALKTAGKVGDVAMTAVSKTGEAAKAPVTAGKKLVSTAAEKFTPMNVKKSITGITPTQEAVLDPAAKMTAGVQAKVAAGKLTEEQGQKIIAQSESPMVKKALQNKDVYDYYTRKSERAVADETLPTANEIAGAQQGGKAMSEIQKKLTRFADTKNAALGEKANEVFSGMSKVNDDLNNLIESEIGAVISKGKVVNAPGRVSKISLTPSDQAILKKTHDILSRLGEAPTVRMVDDAVDAIQGLLYQKKGNVFVPVNSQVEGILKRVTGRMNGDLKRQVGGAYAKANDRYATYKTLHDDLNKALGSEATKGASLLKSLFSPQTGMRTRKLFDRVQKATGVDLSTHAVLAKLAMEASGDVRQRSLLESLGVLENLAMSGAKKLPFVGGVVELGEAAVRSQITPKKVIEEISKKATKK